MEWASGISRSGRGALLLSVVALHVAAILALAAIFAPQVFTRPLTGQPALTYVDIAEPPPVPSSPPEQRRARATPDPGQAGSAGRRATPREVAITEPAIRIAPEAPAPRVASTGTANSAGAAETGSGTGAGGSGDGLGSGAGGDGTGGGSMTPTKPVLVAGDINSAQDYPTPPGGRQVRRGKSVTILLSVSAEGRPTACRIVAPGPDPQADAITCDLALARFRFEPARDSSGRAVAGSFGWRQRWF